MIILTGVSQDDVEALKWYRLAADQGDDQAKSNKEILEKKWPNSK